MIYLPKACGTCSGSSTAVNLVYDLYEREKKKKNGKKIFIYKEILHNPVIIKDLEEKGILCIDDLTKVTSKDIVVIRAHGEPKDTFDYLNKKKIEYYDATCINVKRIHDLVNNAYKDNKSIIIIGKKSHAEVVGTNGWCNNEAFLIENEEDINSITTLKKDTLIVSQTTVSKDMVNNLTNSIKKRFKSNFECIDTVCNAQRYIQDCSADTASKVDIMFVIGGSNSSNTEELYQRCNEKCKSYKFSNINDFFNFAFKEKNINNKKKIAITGGASTPLKQIEDYKDLLTFILFYKDKKLLFKKEMPKYNKSFLNKKDNTIVYDAINELIISNAGGKYIRGSLIALGHLLGSKKDNLEYLPLSIAYELFETSILVHDDIIDNATLRRNVKTIKERYKDKFSNYNSNKKGFLASKENTSSSLALCLGDLGFYLGNNIIVDAYKDNKNLSKLLNYYNNVVINTIKGEIIDVMLPFSEQYNVNSFVNEDDIMEIYKLKTSWYTIIGPFCLGLILSGNDSLLKDMEKILLNVGISFQIKDDIIGIYNDINVIGKTNNDASEYKQTILYAYTMNTKYKEELLKYYGKEKLGNKEIEKIKQIFTDSGAYEYSVNKMNTLFDESISQIRNHKTIPNNIKEILLGLIIFLKIRNK